MTDRFQRAFALLKVHEGGYSDHPRDPGGATMKGVTQRTYDAYRRRQKQPTRSVRQITDGEVERIYRTQYWHAVKADDLPDGVAYCVFDAAVNSGPGRAVRWLQEVAGAKVDGIVGNETISQARDIDPTVLIDNYCDTRLSFMKRLRHWSAFKNGWTRRVAEVRKQAKEWADVHVVATETSKPPPAKADGPENATERAKRAGPAAGAAGSGIASQVIEHVPTVSGLLGDLAPVAQTVTMIAAACFVGWIIWQKVRG